jgi:transcription elongation factor Elf1
MTEKDKFDDFWEEHPNTKPCPFCGSDNLSITKDNSSLDDDFFGFFIECLSCGANAGTGLKEESAYILWQTRSEKNEV